MRSEEIRRLMSELESRVRLDPPGSRRVVFDEPDEASLVAAGFEAAAACKLLGAGWWPEMVEEIVETPAFCDEGEPPEQVLRYARDVAIEYVRKRFSP